MLDSSCPSVKEKEEENEDFSQQLRFSDSLQKNLAS